MFPSRRWTSPHAACFSKSDCSAVKCLDCFNYTGSSCLPLCHSGCWNLGCNSNKRPYLLVCICMYAVPFCAQGALLNRVVVGVILGAWLKQLVLCDCSLQLSWTLAMSCLLAPCRKAPSCAAWRRNLVIVESWPVLLATMLPLSLTTLKQRKPEWSCPLAPRKWFLLQTELLSVSRDN